MSRILSSLVALVWGLWFGGMVFLFAALGAIFTTPGFEPVVQGAFAQRLFPVFERMQLGFAAVALVGTATWWLARRARVKMVLFWLLAAATVIAVVETTMVTPRVRRLVDEGLRGTPEFDRMHKLSTRVYTAGAAVLLIAGLVLPAAIRADAMPVALPHDGDSDITTGSPRTS